MPLILTILAFIWWWPLGLLLLGFLIARGRFGCWRHPMYAGDGPMMNWEHGRDRWERKMSRMQEKMERMRSRMDRVRMAISLSLAATDPYTTRNSSPRGSRPSIC